MSVTEREDRTTAFQRHRPRLFGIAYRMLGVVEDAEDLVQEAYVRWLQADAPAVRTPEAWLVTVITRLAIDRRRRADVERRAYAGPWLPEPVATADWAAPDRATELSSDLSLAFLVLLERLAPEERAAFLLHDVLDCGYAEIAQVLEKSEAACRQMVHRARMRVRQERARFPVNAAVRQQLAERFITAVTAGDRDALLELFAAEATWTSDGGGKVTALRNVLRGVGRIVRFLLGVQRKWSNYVTRRVAWVNGEPAVLAYHDGRLFSVTAFATDGTRILAAYSILNPDKLRRLNA